jgi:aryl-alcohol dehydrogenase-like predicted oxidoreductase
VVGLGCNNFGGRMDLAATRAVVDKAIDLGITLFDTADAYGDPNKGGSEDALGQILGARRKGIVLATKFGLPMDAAGSMKGASRRYVMQAVEASLRRLRTDWIDLYQVHQPDSATPIEETLRALQDLIQQGKVRHIGCSNFSAAQIDEARACAKDKELTPFISCQDQYSLLVRGIEHDLIPAARKHRISLLPYFPLASGMLTGKYRDRNNLPEGSRLATSKRHIERFVTNTNWDMVDGLQQFCDRHHRPMLDLAFGWLLGNPTIASVIAGATKPEQLEANARATSWTLTAEERAEVEQITHAATDPRQGRLG